MQIKINGKKQKVKKTHTLENFIKSKNLKCSHIVIEYNGKIAGRKNWGKIKFNEGDKVEIISFVGGG